MEIFRKNANKGSTKNRAKIGKDEDATRQR